MINRFDRIPARVTDEHKNGKTACRGIVRTTCARRAVKIQWLTIGRASGYQNHATDLLTIRTAGQQPRNHDHRLSWTTAVKPELDTGRVHPRVGQRRRAIEALEARAPPQYCDCGPDWPLLFKVHEI